MAIRHAFVSGKPAASDTSLVDGPRWNADHEGGIEATLLDAKGDLIAASAADTAARLAAAANGAALITDSGAATGLRWRLNNDAASAAPTVTDDSSAGYSAGSRWLDVTNGAEYVCVNASVGAAVWLLTSPLVDLFVGPFNPGAITALSAMAANVARLNAFTVNRAMVAAKAYTRIGVQSGNVDFGVYDDAGTRLASAGSTPCPAAAVTASLTFTTPVTLLPGRRYWVAIAADNSTATFAAQSNSGPSVPGSISAVQVASSFPLPATLTIPSTQAPTLLGLWLAAT